MSFHLKEKDLYELAILFTGDRAYYIIPVLLGLDKIRFLQSKHHFASHKLNALYTIDDHDLEINTRNSRW